MDVNHKSIDRTRPVVRAVDPKTTNENNATLAPTPDATAAFGLVRSMTGPAMEKPDFTMVNRAIEHRLQHQDDAERNDIAQASIRIATQIGGLLPKERKEDDDAWL